MGQLPLGVVEYNAYLDGLCETDGSPINISFHDSFSDPFDSAIGCVESTNFVNIGDESSSLGSEGYSFAWTARDDNIL